MIEYYSETVVVRRREDGKIATYETDLDGELAAAFIEAVYSR